MILAWLLVAEDLRSDQSTLTPLGKMTDFSTALIQWPELKKCKRPYPEATLCWGWNVGLHDAGLRQVKTPACDFSNRELVWVYGKIEHGVRASGNNEVCRAEQRRNQSLVYAASGRRQPTR
jgi:hypothetical protein